MDGTYTCKEADNNSTNRIQVVGRKCKCHHPYCPSCGIVSVKRGLRGLIAMRWDHIRCVTLTVDPERFLDQAEAHSEMEKEISGFIERLRRRGMRIRKYRWFKEWYRNGFPHWHLYIELEQAHTMIGGDLIRECWPHAKWAHETYFRTEAHFKHVVGYAAKSGYMHKDKEHQIRLPQWAGDSLVRIRRTGGTLIRGDRTEMEEAEDQVEIDLSINQYLESLKGGRHRASLTNYEVMKLCGNATMVYALDPVKQTMVYAGRSREEYHLFKRRRGEFMKNLGFCVTMRWPEWYEYFKRHVAMISQTEGG